MSDETPAEGEAFAVPEAEPAPKKRAPRAKSLIEVETEAKAKEAAAARRVERAAPLAEATPQSVRGDVNKRVRVRVLRRGEGRIQTGELDTATNRPSFFAQGAEFEHNEADAMKLEARGYAEICGNA